MPSRKNSKRSNNHTARKGKQAKDSRKFRKVFVNGLTKETSKEMIRRHFEQYGQIEELVKLQHRSSPDNFYAFVVFETEAACHAATQNPCPEIGNDNVYCALAAIGQDYSGLRFFKDAGILKDRSKPHRRSKKQYPQTPSAGPCDESMPNGGGEGNIRRFSESLMGEQIQKLRIHVNAPPLEPTRPRTFPSPPGLVEVNPTPSSHRRYSDSDYESPKRAYSSRSPQRYAFAPYYREMPSPNARSSHRQVFLEQQLTQCTPPVPIDDDIVDFVESPLRSVQYGARHSTRNQQPTLGVPPPSLKPIWPPTSASGDSMRYSPTYSPQQYSPSYGVAGRSPPALYETDAYDADPFRCVCAPSPPGLPSAHSSQHVSPVHTPMARSPSHHTPAHTPMGRSPGNPFGFPSVGMTQQPATPLFPPPSPSPPPPIVPL